MNTIEILLNQWPSPAYSPRKKSPEISVYDGILNVDEGDANVILWAFPELLAWQHDIVWLIAPVSNGPDLIGLDEQGTLLILETKSCDDYRDPFEQIARWINDDRYSDTNHLRKRWEKYWSKEQYALGLGFSAFGTMSLTGVIPYGSKRRACAHWPEIYHTRIHPKLTGDYCEKVNAYMDIRINAGAAAKTWIIIVIHINRKKWHFKYKAPNILKDRVHFRTIEFLEHGNRQGVLLRSKFFT